MSAQKALSKSGTGRGSCCMEQKRKVFPWWEVIDFSSLSYLVPPFIFDDLRPPWKSALTPAKLIKLYRHFTRLQPHGKNVSYWNTKHNLETFHNITDAGLGWYKVVKINLRMVRIWGCYGFRLAPIYDILNSTLSTFSSFHLYRLIILAFCTQHNSIMRSTPEA